MQIKFAINKTSSFLSLEDDLLNFDESNVICLCSEYGMLNFCKANVITFVVGDYASISLELSY